MKVLLVIPALGPVYGGPSKIAPAVAKALGKRGLHVDLVATEANGSENLEVPTGRWLERDGYRTQFFTRLGRAEYKPSFSLWSWLVRHVRDYDVVHSESTFNFPVLACALACRWRGVPHVLNPQGMLEPWALAYKQSKKALYYRLIERPWVLRTASAIQALNGSEAVNLRALQLGPPVVTVANGIEPGETVPPEPAHREIFLDHFPALRGSVVILFMHRVDPKKGLDILAVAYASVRRSFPQTHLVVAGPETLGFEKTARGYFLNAGIGEAEVTFTGRLDGDLRRGALAAASVFVAPSYSEGFSMSVLEAMAAGLPCVITEGCNFPEAGAADAVRIVPAGNAEAFATQMQEILAQPAAAHEMGARAHELVLSRYTWPRIAEELEGVLRTAVQRN